VLTDITYEDAARINEPAEKESIPIERESKENESETPEDEDDPLDKTLFVLDPEAFDKFVELLDSPSEPSDEMRKLMSVKPP
jgi:hypothetical protein